MQNFLLFMLIGVTCFLAWPRAVTVPALPASEAQGASQQETEPAKNARQAEKRELLSTCIFWLLLVLVLVVFHYFWLPLLILYCVYLVLSVLYRLIF